MLRITTPLFYVNNKPHIGHLYTILYADAIKIWKSHTMKAELLTGTDEHGQKVQVQAALHNLNPQEFCDKISQDFRDLLRLYHIKPDVFVRTSDEMHQNFVRQSFQTLLNNQQIISGSYNGWYCQNEESFISDKEVKDGLSPSGYSLEYVKEDNYFLEIDSQRQYIQELLKERSGKYYKELLPELQNLKNICLTRPKSRVQWGINIDGLNSHVVYVWFDALLGYLYGKHQQIKFHHVLGKDILKFHHIHLPFIMKQLDLEYNATYSIHHHWVVEGKKMSKSLNNVVCPIQLLSGFPINATRLMFLSKGPQNYDTSFEPQEIANTYNDYINSFNNSIYRILNKKLLNQNQIQFQRSNLDHNQETSLVEFQSQIKILQQKIDDNDFVNGYIELRKLFFITNKFIDQNAPWKIVDQSQKNNILAAVIVQFRVIMKFLGPYMPEDIDEITEYLGGSISSIPQSLDLKISNDDISKLMKKKLQVKTKI